MVNLKRAIATVIVCFKPHIFLTLCILMVLLHSMIVVLQRSIKTQTILVASDDITRAVNLTVFTITIMFATFFYFVVKYELRNELETLLIFFQCSKRGLRFLGVVVFHIVLLIVVIMIVSSTVENSLPGLGNTNLSRGDTRRSKLTIQPASVRVSSTIEANQQIEWRERKFDEYVAKKAMLERANQMRTTSSELEKAYMSVIYKIWFTAIFYAFLYLIIENVVIFYADLTLIEFVHGLFLALVAKLTGIDLSDYSGGEMLFNPLMNRRIR